MWQNMRIELSIFVMDKYMTIKDIIQETFSALTANKVRTSLTMLGIIIGIGSVIAMVSIGQGAQASIQSSIEGLGSNLLTIYPGSLQPGRGIVSSGRGAAQSLENEDIDVLRSINGVNLVAAELDRRFQITSSLGNNGICNISSQIFLCFY